MSDSWVPGPLLCELMEGHAAEQLALQPQHLAAYATALIETCSRIGRPVVLPDGPGAERLAGAASVLAGDCLELWDRNSRLDNRDVLVLVVADVTGYALEAAGAKATRLGARSLHGCGVAVAERATHSEMATFTTLEPAPTLRRSA